MSSLLALCAGGLVALAFPPTNLWWTAVLGTALLYALVGQRGAGRGAWLGFLFGTGMFAPLLQFTAVSMGNPLGWGALTVLESLYLLVLGAAWSLVSRLPSLRSGRWAAMARCLSFVVLWCGVEELRSSWPWGGFPFGRLAFAMADAPVLAFAAYGGSVGLSLLVALSGACLAEAVCQARNGALVAAPAALIAAGVCVLAPLGLPLSSGAEDGTIRVAAVQGNVAEDFSDAFGRALEVTGNHAEATQQLAADVGAGTLDMVIWPENAADRDPRTDLEAAVLVESAAQAVQAPVLVGAVAYEDDVRYNDVVVWNPGEQPATSYYRKHRPVPFGEYVPLREQLRRVTTQVNRIGTDLVAGTGPMTLSVPAAVQGRDVTLAMGICFEVAYDDTLRAGVDAGGELIVIPTNNASFGRSSESAQQLAQGRVQAVVHGRSLVQVSTVGVTAIISPKGTVEQATKPFTQASLVADIDLRTSRTVADRLGSWPGYVLTLASAVLLGAGMVSRAAARRRSGRRR